MKSRHVPGSCSSWNMGLRSYLANEGQHTEDIIESTTDTLIIRDKYPKSSLHWLVLPKKVELNSVRDLRSEHISLLKSMKDTAKQAISRLYPEKLNVVAYGFHAIPSMRHLHMHVISNDFASTALKKKRHWNSFNTPFFLPIDAVIATLSSGKGVIEIDEEKAHSWLNSTPKCHVCSRVFPSLLPLKMHLQQHFQ